MALLEAQMCGLPVVAGRTGGVPDIVADGETGLLTPEGDDEAFAAALADLLDDPARRARMGLAAARKAAADHDFAGAQMRLQTIIDAALSRHGDSRRDRPTEGCGSP